LEYNPDEPIGPRELARRRRLQASMCPRIGGATGRKLTLAALLVLAMITGSLAGLTLVYSADLPQIHDLERYRPRR